MTHLGNLISLALVGIFTNGIWPGRARDKCPTPYATFIYFGSANNYLSGAASDQGRTVQVDVWSLTSEEAETLADAVEAAMAVQRVGASPTMFTSTLLSRQLAPPDPDVKLQRVVLEFSVWYRP